MMEASALGSLSRLLLTRVGALDPAFHCQAYKGKRARQGGSVSEPAGVGSRAGGESPHKLPPHALGSESHSEQSFAASSSVVSSARGILALHHSRPPTDPCEATNANAPPGDASQAPRASSAMIAKASVRCTSKEPVADQEEEEEDNGSDGQEDGEPVQLSQAEETALALQQELRVEGGAAQGSSAPATSVALLQSIYPHVLSHGRKFQIPSTVLFSEEHLPSEMRTNAARCGSSVVEVSLSSPPQTGAPRRAGARIALRFR
eukprot:RCo005474